MLDVYVLRFFAGDVFRFSDIIMICRDTLYILFISFVIHKFVSIIHVLSFFIQNETLKDGEIRPMLIGDTSALPTPIPLPQPITKR